MPSLKSLEYQTVKQTVKNSKIFLPGMSKPKKIFFQGEIELIKNDYRLAIVGSRLIKNYSKQVMSRFLSTLPKGIIIVSGLAYGVDSLAHELALENGLRVIGVLGSGIDDESFYPKANLNLKYRILEAGGLIISEQELGKKPAKYTFPMRNKLMSVISDTVWVVQASRGSGSLLTAKYAKNLEKPVYTTPVNIFQEGYEGNLELLQNGALPLIEIKDLDNVFKKNGLFSNSPETSIPKQVPKFQDVNKHNIYVILDYNEKSFEEIQKTSKLKTEVIINVLSELELEGYIQTTGLNKWIKLT